MERTTLEVIAPTVEDAIANGLRQLGLPQDAVDVDILDSGSKGFLGIGGRQVRVRLTVKLVDASAPAEPKKEQAAPEPAPVAESEDHLVAFARQTVNDLISRMKIEARVTARRADSDESGDPTIQVDVRGDDLSVLIGRRSETLNALQYISALIVSKEAGHWVQIIVDVEGYRARRERQLRQLARRMADQAIKTGKRQVLEPMSSSERRIIHLELRNHPDVLTESVGEEPNRKVTIQLK